MLSYDEGIYAKQASVQRLNSDCCNEWHSTTSPQITSHHRHNKINNLSSCMKHTTAKGNANFDECSQQKPTNQPI